MAAPRTWSPKKVLSLRSEGVTAIASAVGRRPGIAQTPPGVTLRTLQEAMIVLRSDPDLTIGVVPLLAAVAWVESQGDTLAVSSTGALGLMQLTQPLWWETEPALNPFHWQDAARRAARFLMAYMDRAVREGHPDPRGRALQAYKEGWVGSSRHPSRALAYQRKVEAELARMGL